LKKKLRIVIVIQGKIKEIVSDCDPSGVSDIKKHLKRKFIEKPSQDDKGMEKDENNHDNTPLDTEHHHHHYHYLRTNSQKLMQTCVTKQSSSRNIYTYVPSRTFTQINWFNTVNILEQSSKFVEINFLQIFFWWKDQRGIVGWAQS